MNDLIDMCKRERELTVSIQLNIDKWSTIDNEVKNIISEGWSNIKFLNDEGSGINERISEVPDDMGGVYVFLIKPDIIPNIHRYVMYIGRARRKSEFSLRKRCKGYISDTRPLVAYMREIWGKQLYLYYLPLQDDELIEKVERELLRVVIPPCNTQIPDRYVTVMPQEAAF